MNHYFVGAIWLVKNFAKHIMPPCHWLQVVAVAHPSAPAVVSRKTIQDNVMHVDLFYKTTPVLILVIQDFMNIEGRV